MPFTLRMDEGVVIATCSGSLGLDESMRGAQAFWDRPEWRDTPVLWDSPRLRRGARVAAVVTFRRQGAARAQSAGCACGWQISRPSERGRPLLSVPYRPSRPLVESTGTTR